MFTYRRPANEIQKHYNKEDLAIVEAKRAQFILNLQAADSGYFLQHKLKSNYLDYHEAFVKSNRKYGNRHIEKSFTAFKAFIGESKIAAHDITEKLCIKFQDIY